MDTTSSLEQIGADRLEDGIRTETLRVTPAVHERVAGKGAIRNPVKVGGLLRMPVNPGELLGDRRRSPLLPPSLGRRNCALLPPVCALTVADAVGAALVFPKQGPSHGRASPPLPVDAAEDLVRGGLAGSKSDGEDGRLGGRSSEPETPRCRCPRGWGTQPWTHPWETTVDPTGGWASCAIPLTPG